MKRKLRKIMCAAMALVLLPSMLPLSGTVAAAQNDTQRQSSDSLGNKPYVEGEVLVISSKYSGNSAGKSVNSLDRTTERLGAEIEESDSIDLKGEGFLVSLIKSDKYSTKELMREYSGSTGVQAVQPNYIYHMSGIDSVKYDNMLWGISNQGQNGGKANVDINSDSEKIKIATGEESKEKVVAIIDTGVDYNNPNLSTYIWDNPYKTYLKGGHGYDFANYDADPIDDNGHGTHCAGIVSSIRNGENIKIMPLKFLDSDGYGDTYGAIGAYYYIYNAQCLGVNIVAVNNSWGGGSDIGDSDDELLNKMIRLVGEKGAVSVCASGNESENMENYYSSPASLDNPYIVSVAAANEKGDLASFSNYGKNVDVAAPGTSILSSVSYNCFNPSVYGEKDGKKSLCSVFQDFSGNLALPGDDMGEESIYCELKQGDMSAGTQEIVLTEETFFGENGQGEKSLEWHITEAQTDDTYTLYLPYRQETSTTPVHYNIMLKSKAPKAQFGNNLLSLLMGTSTVMISDVMVDENGNFDSEKRSLAVLNLDGENDQWTQISMKKDAKVNKAGNRAIALLVTINQPGDYVITLDNFAISQSNVEEAEFGNTAFYEGTSMATPYVTGAVADLSNAYPEDSIEERIARIKGAVTKTEGLKGKVASDGLIDLSKVDKPEPSFEKAEISDDGKLVINGRFLDESAKVRINGEEVNEKSVTEKSITVDGDFYNKALEVEISIGDKIFTDKCFFAHGNSPSKVAQFPYTVSEASMAGSKDKVYVVASNGEVYAFHGESFAEADMPDVMYLGGGFEGANIFDNPLGETQIEGNPVCIGNNMYAIAVSDSGFLKEAALVSYEIDKMQWSIVANLPDEYKGIGSENRLYAYDKPILASYNEKIYLLGGFDCSKEKPVNNVYEYNLKDGKWSQAVSMPEGRFAGKAVQAGDRLVVTLGGDGSEKCPANLIFDGNSWTVSKAQINVFEIKEYFYDDENMKKALYADGEVGVSSNIIVYAGCRADNMSDIFNYDFSEDKFSASGYCLEGISDDREVFAACLGEKMYIITSPKLNLSVFNENEEYAASYIYSLQTGDLKYCVKESNPQSGGKVSGTGMYKPGSNVKITAKPNKNYYLKKLLINGKSVSVKKGGVITTISDIESDVDVHAEFGAYVTKLVPAKKKINLGAGRKTKLQVSILPKNAEVKSLSFKSGNTKVVTVDSKGVIKANKKAVGKSAVITITAKDRKTVVAKCSVKVVKAVNAKKITLSTSKNVKKVKAGDSLTIKASISPKNADVKELAWSVDNKKYATVKKGKVTAYKAGIGKTVTITAKATDGSKVKASIKIKIVK